MDLDINFDLPDFSSFTASAETRDFIDGALGGTSTRTTTDSVRAFSCALASSLTPAVRATSWPMTLQCCKAAPAGENAADRASFLPLASSCSDMALDDAIGTSALRLRGEGPPDARLRPQSRPVQFPTPRP